MSTGPTIGARMPGADLQSMVSVYLANREELANPDSLDWPSFRARRWLEQATCGYAVGMPLSQVREEGHQALLAYRLVQRDRPSLQELTGKDRVLRDVPLGSLPRVRRVVRVDGSAAASWVTLRYLYWALLLRESDLAMDLASEIWDPGPPHEPDVQLNRIAHALRSLLLGAEDVALDQLSQIRRTGRKHEHQQAAAISAIARGSAPEAVQALHELAAWHRRAKTNEYLQSEKALCRSASGLGALALDRCLLSATDLPVNLDSFATDLVLNPPVASETPHYAV
jgi:hypothetical protein